MKKRVAGFLVGCIALAFSLPSVTVAMPYVRGSVGLASMGTDSNIAAGSYDSGYGFTGAIGTDGGKYRVELEMAHQKNGVKSAADDLSITSYMANYYFDLVVPVVAIKPYVSAGAGLGNIEKNNGLGGISTDRVFAWQVGAGAGFTVAPFVTLDLQYRRLGSSSPELAGQKYSIGSNNVTVGLRVGL